jgi:hypothetical protein
MFEMPFLILTAVTPPLKRQCLSLFFAQNPNAHPRPTSQDLAGFWDMLQLSIENISMKFDELHQLKANNWKQMDPLDKKVEQCRFCMVHLKPCTNAGQSK